MNLSSDALLYLAAKGLSVADIAEFVRLTEQRKDPTAADRMARYRARKNGKKRVTRNVTANPLIEELHNPVPDISSDEESQSPSANDDTAAVLQAWNAMAGAHDLAGCSKMTGKRLRSCQARLRDDGLGAIQRAIARIPTSQFLLGQTGNWSASIDWLLKPDSVTQILEGKYDDRTSQTNRTTGSASPDRRSALARAIDESRDWLDSAQAGVP